MANSSQTIRCKGTPGSGGTAFNKFNGSIIGGVEPGGTTEFTITHNLGSTDVIVQVWENYDDFKLLAVETEIIDANSIRVTILPAPTGGQDFDIHIIDMQ